MLVLAEPEGAAWQLEQDDDAVATLRRLRAMSQHVRRVPLQRFLARLLPRILHHVSRRSHVYTRLSIGKSSIFTFLSFLEIGQKQNWSFWNVVLEKNA